MLRTNFRRTLILQQRNKIFSIIRTSQVLLMAFVVSTMFWRVSANDWARFERLHKPRPVGCRPCILVGSPSRGWRPGSPQTHPGRCAAPPSLCVAVQEDKNTVDDGNLFMGVLFYSVLYQLLGGISEMHLLVARLRWAPTEHLLHWDSSCHCTVLSRSSCSAAACSSASVMCTSTQASWPSALVLA